MSVGGVGSGPSLPEIPDEYTAPSPDGEPAAGGTAPWAFNPLKPGSIDIGLGGLGGLGGINPIFLPKYDEQGSFRLKTLGSSALAGLEEASKRDLMGPEARLSSFGKGEMADALRSIESDEAKARALPLDSPERRKLEDQIDARVRNFENSVALETLKTAKEIEAKKGKKGAEGFKSLLPPALQSLIKDGIAIPGVPGTFKPRTDNGILGGPTGLDWKGKFD